MQTTTAVPVLYAHTFNRVTMRDVGLRPCAFNGELWEMWQDGRWVGARDLFANLVRKLERNGYAAAGSSAAQDEDEMTTATAQTFTIAEQDRIAELAYLMKDATDGRATSREILDRLVRSWTATFGAAAVARWIAAARA